MLFPSPGDLPDPVIEPTSFTLADGFFTTESPGKPRFRNSNKNTSPLYSQLQGTGKKCVCLCSGVKKLLGWDLAYQSTSGQREELEINRIQRLSESL